MPNYRNGSDEYLRKPKMIPDRRYDPDWGDEEEDDMYDDRKCFKKPVVCKCEFPFKVLVKVVPICDHRHSTLM